MYKLTWNRTRAKLTSVQATQDALQATQEALQALQPTQEALRTLQPTQDTLQALQATQDALQALHATQDALRALQPKQDALQPTQDALWALQPRQDAPWAFQPRQDAPRALQPRQDAPRALQPRQDAPRALQPRQDAPRALQPRQDAPRALQPRQDALRALHPRQDAPWALHPRQDAPRALQPTQDAPRALQPTQDAPRALQPTQDGLRALQPTQDGLRALQPTQDGLRALQPTQDGLRALQAKQDGLRALQAKQDGLRALQAKQDGLRALQAKQDALRALHPRQDAPRALQPTQDGLRAKQDGLQALQSKQDALRGLRARQDALQAIQARQDAVEAKQDALQAKQDALQALEAKQDAVRALRAKQDAVRALRATQDALRATQNALRATQDALRATQDALRATQDALQAKQDALQAKQDALQATQGALQAKQDALQALNDTCAPFVDKSAADSSSPTSETMLDDDYKLQGKSAPLSAYPLFTFCSYSSGPWKTSCLLPCSHSMVSLSKIPCANNNFTYVNSSPDMLLKEFTPVINDDFDDETYLFQCSSPGLYQCSVTGLVFAMKGEGDVVYRTVPWNRRLLAQHHKKPAGPLFDITCLQQSVCQLHLPHCEVISTGGGQSLKVAHLKDEGIEFIPPHQITETHVVIKITGFSGYGIVKDEDSPPDPVQALVLLFYKPPEGPDLGSVLSVLLLPRNIVIRDVQCTRRNLNGDERYVDTSPHCKLHPKQVYTLSTAAEDDLIKVQPKETDFYDEYHDSYFPSFQVILRRILTDVNLSLKDKGSSSSVWERDVCLFSPRVETLNRPPSQRLLNTRSCFIEGISGPVLSSLIYKLLEKTMITDADREKADAMQNRREKARFVIDTVRSKGEAASSELINFLHENDHILCEHLGLN